MGLAPSSSVAGTFGINRNRQSADTSTSIGRNIGDFMFIHSQKGKIQLKSHDGYLYVKEKNVNDKIYWRCTRYTTKLRCHARVHTVKHEIVRQTEHNHDPIARRRRSVVDREKVEFMMDDDLL